MEKTGKMTGTLLYGLILAVTIPVALVLWAKYTDSIVRFPLPDIYLFGYVPLILGVILFFSGIWHHYRTVTISPEDVVPAQNSLKSGIYSILRYPVSAGAILICFGLSAICRSASGFWLVSPLFSMLTAAVVAGSKNKSLSASVPPDYKPFLSLPSSSDTLPSFGDRISSSFLSFIPWLIIYEAFIFIGAPDNAIITNLKFEEQLPVWEFSEAFYSLAILFSLTVPFILKSRKQLRSFVTDIWFTMIFVAIIYMTFPLVVNQRDFIPHSFLGHLILFERSIDGESGALPSCHVIWAFLAAAYFSKRFVRLKWFWYALAVLISVSCVTTGAHSIPDVVAGFIAFIIIIYWRSVRDFLLRTAERLLNNRKEWSYCQFRITNHSFFWGVTGFAGVLIAGCFPGRHIVFAGSLIIMFIISIAAFFREKDEKSAKFRNTYGIFIVLTSAILACFLADKIFSADFFVLTGSLALAAPWIRAIGRLRSSVPPGKVLFYLAGIDIITGMILISLFNIGMSSSFITGIYLILAGITWLFEASFRNEVKRIPVAAVRSFPWMVVLCVLSGMIITTLPGTVVLYFQPGLTALILASGAGILTVLASGINTQRAVKRFANQLTGKRK